MPIEKPLRLFFALPCPPELAERICSWRDGQAFDGRPVPRENLHLTLAFLGSQPETALDDLRQLGDRLRSESIRLRLDRVQTIGHGFLCLTPSQAPAPLLQLVDQLRGGLSALGVALDPRPFLPHVTLAREAGIGQTRPTGDDLDWPVEGFGLFRSQNVGGGVRYDELMHWPLSASSC